MSNETRSFIEKIFSDEEKAVLANLFTYVKSKVSNDQGSSSSVNPEMDHTALDHTALDSLIDSRVDTNVDTNVNTHVNTRKIEALKRVNKEEKDALKQSVKALFEKIAEDLIKNHKIDSQQLFAEAFFDRIENSKERKVIVATFEMLKKVGLFIANSEEQQARLNERLKQYKKSEGRRVETLSSLSPLAPSEEPESLYYRICQDEGEKIIREYEAACEGYRSISTFIKIVVTAVSAVLGAAIGAGAGFLLGGPIGAGIGAGIGGSIAISGAALFFAAPHTDKSVKQVGEQARELVMTASDKMTSAKCS